MKTNKTSALKYNLALLCTLTHCFAMKDPNLDNNPAYDKGASQLIALTNATNPPRQRSRFFSDAELADIEIGRAIIHNRIANKQAVIDSLRNPNEPSALKQIIIQDDFGVVFHEPGSLDEQSIERGCQFYCDYLTKIIKTYSFADQLAQLMLSAESMADKNRHQNNLYYFLSYHIIHFKEFTTSTFRHEIPEHSLEDTFYEMILSKIGSTATKEYDVITRYLKITKTPLGMQKQIDNERLYSEYRAKHTEAMVVFKKGDFAHPVTWLGLLDEKEIKESATTQFNKVSSALQKCADDMIQIMNTLSRELSGHGYEPATIEDSIFYAYNYFGPRVLETIHRFEEITRTINALKEDSDRWLRGIKDKKKLFAKIPKEQQGVITDYFSYWEEKARAEEKAKTRAKAAEKKAEEEAIKAQKREKERLRKERKALRDAARIAEEAARQHDMSHSMSHPTPAEINALGAAVTDLHLAATNAGDTDESGTLNMPPVLNTEKIAAVAAPLAIMPSSPVDLPAAPKVEENPSTVASVHKETTTPRIKIKTRKADPSLLLSAPDDAKEDNPTPTLPEQFRTEAFTSLVQDLLDEKNDRKLIQLFKELKTTFGLDSDTNEKKNKGYFSIISPIDQTVKIATYHHYHTENPFGSIFMAVKDVLIAAHIIQR